MQHLSWATALFLGLAVAVQPVSAAAAQGQQGAVQEAALAEAWTASFGPLDEDGARDRQCFDRTGVRAAPANYVIASSGDAPECSLPGGCSTEIVITATDQGCVATWPFEAYKVRQGDRNVKLRWTLKAPAGASAGRYQFSARRGISICRQSKNRPALDVVEPNRCADVTCQAYELTSRNLKPRHRRDDRPPFDASEADEQKHHALHFAIVVVDTQWRAPNQPEAPPERRICAAIDPLIVNRGP